RSRSSQSLSRSPKTISKNSGSIGCLARLTLAATKFLDREEPRETEHLCSRVIFRCLIRTGTWLLAQESLSLQTAPARRQVAQGAVPSPREIAVAPSPSARMRSMRSYFLGPAARRREFLDWLAFLPIRNF